MTTEGIVLIVVFVVFAVSLIFGTRNSRKKAAEDKQAEDKQEVEENEEKAEDEEQK